MDINIAEDLIEEIGRVYGYENITAEPPRGLLVVPRRNEQVFWRARAREIFAGFGFLEVYNYSFISANARCGSEDLELDNPASDEFRYLRPALWPGIFKNISLNEKSFDSVRVFEIGKVFLREENGPKENENLIFVASANDSGPDTFYGLKGYLDEFFNKLGIADFYLDHALSAEEEEFFNFLHPARRANIVLNGEKIGYIGEIHPRKRENFDIKQRIFCAELDFGKIVAAAEEEHIYQKSSKYPEVVRDIALLVPRETMIEEVLNIIETAGGPLLRDTDLFDIYSAQGGPASGGEGPIWAEDKKSLAFHLLFQSDERTLTSEEVDEIMEKIYVALRDGGWEVR